jgi:hypothetical protein
MLTSPGWHGASKDSTIVSRLRLKSVRPIIVLPVSVGNTSARDPAPSRFGADPLSHASPATGRRASRPARNQCLPRQSGPGGTIKLKRQDAARRRASGTARAARPLRRAARVIHRANRRHPTNGGVGVWSGREGEPAQEQCPSGHCSRRTPRSSAQGPGIRTPAKIRRVPRGTRSYGRGERI